MPPRKTKTPPTWIEGRLATLGDGAVNTDIDPVVLAPGYRPVNEAGSGCGIAIAPIDECGRLCRSFFNRSRDQPVMVFGKTAGRIRPSGIAGDGESLAAASAPIDFLAVAGTARLRHPIGPPERCKSFRIAPDIVQTALAHIVEGQAGDGLCCVAGQDIARGRDIQEPAAPAAHAGFGAAGIIVRHDKVDDDDALEPLPGLRDLLGHL